MCTKKGIRKTTPATSLGVVPAIGGGPPLPGIVDAVAPAPAPGVDEENGEEARPPDKEEEVAKR